MLFKGVLRVILDTPNLAFIHIHHSRLVEREIGKCEALCKVLMSPLEGIRDTFVALLPEGSPEDFAAVCELKGMKKQDAAHAAQTLRAVRAAQGR